MVVDIIGLGAWTARLAGLEDGGEWIDQGDWI